MKQIVFTSVTSERFKDMDNKSQVQKMQAALGMGYVSREDYKDN